MPQDTIYFLDSPPLLPVPAPGLPALERKRQVTWHNDARNRLLVKIATAAAERRIEALWDLGLLLDETELPWGPGAWVVLLVEGLEHGEVLHGMLPDWNFMHAAPKQRDRAPKPVGMLPPAIVTVTVATILRDYSPGVEINAIGGDWILPLAPKTEISGKRIFFDLADDVDKEASDGTISRLRQYAGADNNKPIAPARWRTWPGRH